MALIALGLCLGLVCMLVYRDSRRWPEQSRGLWVPTVWVMYAASRPLSAWGARGDQVDVSEKLQAIAEGNPLERNFQLILLFLGVVVLIRRRLDWRTTLRDHRALLLLAMFCGLSVLWSDSPFVSFRRWVKNGMPLVAALVVFTEKDPLHALTAVFRRCAYVLLPLSLVLIMYYPKYGVSNFAWAVDGGFHYTGVTTNKNSLGRLCMVSCYFLMISFPLLWRSDQRKRWLEAGVLGAFAGLSLYMLIKANSANAVASLFIGAVAFFGLGTRFVREHTGRVVAITLLIFLLYIAAEFTVGVIDRVAYLLGRDPSLTGRVGFWKDLLGVGTNPLIGVGFSTFWEGNRAESLWDKYPATIHQAHNGYLDVYLQVGLIGLGLLFNVILSTYRKGLRALSLDSLQGRCALSLLALVVVNNWTDASFFGAGVVLMLLVAAGGFPARAPTVQVQDEPTAKVNRRSSMAAPRPRRMLPGPVPRRRSPALSPKRVLQ